MKTNTDTRLLWIFTPLEWMIIALLVFIAMGVLGMCCSQWIIDNRVDDRTKALIEELADTNTKLTNTQEELEVANRKLASIISVPVDGGNQHDDANKELAEIKTKFEQAQKELADARNECESVCKEETAKWREATLKWYDYGKQASEYQDSLENLIEPERLPGGRPEFPEEGL